MNLKAMLPEIEAAAVRGWPAPETAGVDGWLWRYASGGSVRANSVAALAFTGRDVTAAIAKVEAHARQRGAAACFSISDVSAPADLDARLEAHGYARGEDHVTMAKSVVATATLPDGVVLAHSPSPGWMEAYLSGLSENRRAVAPRILERLPASAVYVGATIDGKVVSSGLTIGDGNVASVQCMATLPDAQRHGGAQRVLRGIEHVAAGEGRKAIYLQTGADNVGAQALYTRAGYVVIGRYHTRTKNV